MKVNEQKIVGKVMMIDIGIGPRRGFGGTNKHLVWRKCGSDKRVRATVACIRSLFPNGCGLVVQ